MGCRFCASTLDGLVRGLRPSEMIDQIYQIGKDIGERISNVVVMGTGEPLDNYDNLLRFIELLTDEKRYQYQPAQSDSFHMWSRTAHETACR